MIKIDLKNLTEEMVAEARPHMGQCRYSAPCIIGALLTPEERVMLDCLNTTNSEDTSSDLIGDLISARAVKFATPWQEGLAKRLQSAFDMGDIARFDNLLAEIKDLP